jgi:5-methylcytosine-specific restriction endonuclease McrA
LKPDKTIVPQREEVEPERRKSLSVRAKLAILLAHPYCEICKKKLDGLDGLEFDHILPIALGGEDTPENLRGVHKNCHLAKTADDMERIAKANRLKGRRLDKPQRKKRKIPSRPFPSRKNK